jgi:broad specificity phosphatase PhoE
MRIGLMRHLKVDYSYSFAEDAAGFRRQVDNYDRADVLHRNGKARGTWDICYASSLKRARKTASLLYNGKVIVTDTLREVPANPVCRTRLRLPVIGWFTAARLAWIFNCKSQPEGRSRTGKRAREFLRTIFEAHPPHARILVVSHGFFMLNLGKALKESGFKGGPIVKPGHAKLYIYEK